MSVNEIILILNKDISVKRNRAAGGFKRPLMVEDKIMAGVGLNAMKLKPFNEFRTS